MIRWCAIVLVLAVVGCGTSPPTPEQTCRDTAEKAADAAKRCGDNKEFANARFMQQAAGGTCANVTMIRDENALRKQCFPWLEKASCTAIWGSTFDPSCIDQLQRSSDAGRD